MNKLITLCSKAVLATFAIFLFASCNTVFDYNNGIDGNGNVIKQTRNAVNFTRIEINRGLNVTVEQSESYFVEVEVDENLQPHIITKVENGTLIITTDESINLTNGLKIHVKLPLLTYIDTSSGSTCKSKGILVGTDITVKSSSGSTSNLDLKYDTISSKSSSGSSITLSGKALKLSTDSSSGSSIEAEELLVNDVVSETSSGSTTNVHPLVSLNAKASSGSSVNYNSNPKTVTKEESSGGSVSKE
jgi:Putative auto-transporter adhesin, head GIN domain